MKNFVFDVGGVLLQNGIADFLWEKMTYKEDVKIVNEEMCHSVERVQLDRGVIGKEEAFERMLSRIPQRSRTEAKNLFEEYMGNRKVMCGMVEFLEKLKAQGHKLYVLSNFSVDFNEVIQKNNFQFFDLFDGIFVSSFYQTVKPESEIFDAFLRKYGLDAVDCFFVDDKEENVEAAIHKGFGGFVFRGDVDTLEAYIKEIEVA